jgi:hypothetical protein
VSSRTLDLRFTGPDLFCPDCRRCLVHIHDGRFDLAGKAEVTWLVMEPDWEESEAEAYPDTARCNRVLCRFRRWARGE